MNTIDPFDLPDRRLTPSQVILLLRALREGTLVLLEREDGMVDLEVNPAILLNLETPE